MNGEDIIRLAIEHTIHGLKFNEDGLIRFAKLIAEHERAECANEAENTFYSVQAAENIRARKQA